MSLVSIRRGSLHIEGHLLHPAILDAQAMAYMNFARAEHRKLESLVRTIIIPMLGGYQNELAKELERHLEQARTFSGNFCWQHRHLGASHGVVGEGEGV
ncbi:hypothetical protein [Pseudomonas sp. JV241A]|uniref:hypothetical protein n=1 Tax=Pseudomonas sp. JV241A TaxID=2078785 RepID=UPI00100CBCD4|nr:hypothetical protein [Pseudomonas sp. JV241A]SPO68137.1 conserved protein of unknown function [Pseudomonas sp. JV241A]